jgi:MYXO-CTERM domain-containing protein
LLCGLIIASYAVLFPEAFQISGSPIDVYTHVAAWAGLLILAGAVVGRRQES